MGLDSHQIQILCEYLQSHCSDSSVCEASRVLLQLVVFARGNEVTKSIQELYIDIIIHSRAELDEFVTMGECLAQLLQLYRSYGTDCFKGCNVELPFGDISCDPKKYSLPVRSLRSVLDLLSFWSCVVVLLYQDQVTPHTVSTVLNSRILSVIVDITKLLPDFDATAAIVMSICEAIEAVLLYSHSALVHLTCANSTSAAHPACQVLDGLVGWASYALQGSLHLCQSEPGGSTLPLPQVVSPAKPASVTAEMFSQMARVMRHISQVAQSVILHAREDSTLAINIDALFGRVCAVLQSQIAHNTTITPPWNSSTPSAKDVVCLVVAELVQIASVLKTASVSAQPAPSVALFQSVCVDLTTLHAVAGLFSQHLRADAELSAELVGSWNAPLSHSKNGRSGVRVREVSRFTPVSPLGQHPSVEVLSPQVHRHMHIRDSGGDATYAQSEVAAVLLELVGRGGSLFVRELSEMALSADPLSVRSDGFMAVLVKVRK